MFSGHKLRLVLVVGAVLLLGGCGSERSQFERSLSDRAERENLETFAFNSHLVGASRYVILRGPDINKVQVIVAEFLADEGFQKGGDTHYLRKVSPKLVYVDVLPGPTTLTVPSDAPDEAKRSEPGVMVSFSP